MKSEKSNQKRQDKWHDHYDEDKYLAMEQPGVTYTDEGHPTLNSDQLVGGREPDTYNPATNSRNADAFSQDDYLLNDNIDLDEDQNISLSNEDADK